MAVNRVFVTHDQAEIVGIQNILLLEQSMNPQKAPKAQLDSKHTLRPDPCS